MPLQSARAVVEVVYVDTDDLHPWTTKETARNRVGN
jgi:hypothetical protein